MQKGNKIAAAERERRAGKPENIDERIRKRNDKLLKFQKFSQKQSRILKRKEASGKTATDSRKICKRSGLRTTHRGLGTGVRLASRRARELLVHRRPPSQLASASNFQAVRGQRLHGTWRSPGTNPAGIRRPRGDGPIRRPLCYERATHPARPRRERENSSKKSKFRGSKRRQTDDFFHPSLHSERIQTDALGLAACDEARPAKVQKSFVLPEPILCNGVPC